MGSTVVVAGLRRGVTGAVAQALRVVHAAHLPRRHRVDDSQFFDGATGFLAEMKAWADRYHPNPVLYRIGLPDDLLIVAGEGHHGGVLHPSGG